VNQTGQAAITRLRVFFAVIALAMSFASAPIALACQQSETCSMACCVREGHCCCSPHRKRVSGQSRTAVPTINEPELAASCPEGCAGASTLKIAPRDSIRGTSALFNREAPASSNRELTSLAKQLVASLTFPSRAPPSSLDL
jgi:hypothetical protein